MESLLLNLKIQSFSDTINYDVQNEPKQIQTLNPSRALLRFVQETRSFDDGHKSESITNLLYIRYFGMENRLINTLVRELKSSISASVIDEFKSKKEKDDNEKQQSHLFRLITQIIAETNNKLILVQINEQLKDLKSEIDKQKQDTLSKLQSNDDIQKLKDISVINLDNNDKIKNKFQDDFIEYTSDNGSSANQYLLKLMDKQGLQDRIQMARNMHIQISTLFEDQFKEVNKEIKNYDKEQPKFSFAPIKNFERSFEKIKEYQVQFKEQNKNSKLEQLKDILRGTLIFKDPAMMTKFYQNIQNRYKTHSSIKIVEVKNSFLDVVKTSEKKIDPSYRDIKVIFKISMDYYEEQVEMILILKEQYDMKSLDHKIYDFQRLNVDNETQLQLNKVLQYQQECVETKLATEEMIEYFIYQNLQKDKEILLQILNVYDNPFYLKQIEETVSNCIIDHDYKNANKLMIKKDLILKKLYSKMLKNTGESINKNDSEVKSIKDYYRKQMWIEEGNTKSTMAQIMQEKGRYTKAKHIHMTVENIYLQAIKFINNSNQEEQEKEKRELLNKSQYSVYKQGVCNFKECNQQTAIELFTKLEAQYLDQFKMQYKDAYEACYDIDQNVFINKLTDQQCLKENTKKMPSQFEQFGSLMLQKARSKQLLSKSLKESSELSYQFILIATKIFLNKQNKQHKYQTMSITHRALILLELGKVQEALKDNFECLTIRRWLLGDLHNDTTFNQQGIAKCFFSLLNEDASYLQGAIIYSYWCLLLRNIIWSGVVKDSLGIGFVSHAIQCRVAIFNNTIEFLKNEAKTNLKLQSVTKEDKESMLDEMQIDSYSKVLKNLKEARFVLNSALGENHDLSINVQKDIAFTYIYMGIEELEKSDDNKSKFDQRQNSENQFQSAISTQNLILSKKKVAAQYNYTNVIDQANALLLTSVVYSFHKKNFVLAANNLIECIDQLKTSLKNNKRNEEMQVKDDLAYFFYQMAYIFENDCKYNLDQGATIDNLSQQIQNVLQNISQLLFSISSNNFSGQSYRNQNHLLVNFKQKQYTQMEFSFNEVKSIYAEIFSIIKNEKFCNIEEIKIKLFENVFSKYKITEVVHFSRESLNKSIEFKRENFLSKSSVSSNFALNKSTFKDAMKNQINKSRIETEYSNINSIQNEKFYKDQNLTQKQIEYKKLKNQNMKQYIDLENSKNELKRQNEKLLKEKEKQKTENPDIDIDFVSKMKSDFNSDKIIKKESVSNSYKSGFNLSLTLNLINLAISASVGLQLINTVGK